MMQTHNELNWNMTRGNNYVSIFIDVEQYTYRISIYRSFFLYLSHSLSFTHTHTRSPPHSFSLWLYNTDACYVKSTFIYRITTKHNNDNNEIWGHEIDCKPKIPANKSRMIFMSGKRFIWHFVHDYYCLLLIVICCSGMLWRYVFELHIWPIACCIFSQAESISCQYYHIFFFSSPKVNKIVQSVYE